MEINENTKFGVGQTDTRGFRNRRAVGETAGDRTTTEGSQYIRGGDWIYPDSGGIYTPIVGGKHPMPGKIDGDIADRNNQIKMMSLGYLKTFANLLKFWKGWRPPVIEFLTGWVRQVKWVAHQDFLEKWPVNRYQPFCAELMLIGYCFLRGLKLPIDLCLNVPECAVVMLEHDDQYRNRPLDLMGEFNREAFLENPGREVDRIFEIYAQREKLGSLVEKGKAIKLLIKIILLWPQARRSLINAIAVANMDALQPRIMDAYWAMDNSTYDFGGYTFEQRVTLWWDLHEGKLPPKVTWTIKPDEK